MIRTGNIGGISTMKRNFQEMFFLFNLSFIYQPMRTGIKMFDVCHEDRKKTKRTRYNQLLQTRWNKKKSERRRNE